MSIARADGGIIITPSEIHAWAGRALTGDELARLAEAIPYSSIPDAIGTITSGALGIRGDDEEGNTS